MQTPAHTPLLCRCIHALLALARHGDVSGHRKHVFLFLCFFSCSSPDRPTPARRSVFLFVYVRGMHGRCKTRDRTCYVCTAACMNEYWGFFIVQYDAFIQTHPLTMFSSFDQRARPINGARIHPGPDLQRRTTGPESCSFHCHTPVDITTSRDRWPIILVMPTSTHLHPHFDRCVR